MQNYSSKTYGERIAGVYDQYYSEYDSASVQVLAELADGRNALELGIGTGRIALPLLQKGISVHGIDISESMVAQLHAKPGGERIPVTMGNFADVKVEGQFSVIYIVANTFYSLLTQEEQISCFQNVAKHLTPDGAFVIEAFLPELTRFTSGQAMRATHIGENEVRMDISMIELDKQLINSQHMVINEQGTHFYPVRLRYAWPSEMDLMARVNNMRLRARWGDWKKNAFTSASRLPVSVYEHWD